MTCCLLAGQLRNVFTFTFRYCNYTAVGRSKYLYTRALRVYELSLHILPVMTARTGEYLQLTNSVMANISRVQRYNVALD